MNTTANREALLAAITLVFTSAVMPTVSVWAGELPGTAMNGCAGSGGGFSSRSSESSANNEMDRLKRDATAGDAKKQYILGSRYEAGDRIPADLGQAAYWYEKSASQGYADAQQHLAMLYISGRGVEQNYQTAAVWLQRAVDQDNTQCAFLLGVLYASGDKFPLDYQHAVALWTKAADKGHALAQHNLGLAYLYGNGVEKNYAEAYKWLNLAEKNGDSNAAEPRQIAATKLGLDQQSNAQP